MTTNRRRELAFQKHILQSYERVGGYGMKWNSEWQAGPPDLVVALAGYGVHLIEVKHRPEWVEDRVYKNPLTKKQIDTAKDYSKAGGLVIGAVVTASQNALGSMLTLFDPINDEVYLDPFLTMAYDHGGRATKYPVKELLERYVYARP